MFRHYFIWLSFVGVLAIGQPSMLSAHAPMPSPAISIQAPPPLDFTITNDQSICLYQSVSLHVQVNPNNDNYTFSWSPAIGLSDASSSSTLASPPYTTNYVCTISSLDGTPMAQGSVTVTVTNGSISQMGIAEESVSYCSPGSASLSVQTETVLWSDDFDPGIAWGSWEDITNASASANCGSINDQALYFNGTTNREAITTPMNLSAGGSIQFYLKIGAGSAPCDNAEPGDHVVLSYSVANGPWITLITLNEADFGEFSLVQLPVPLAAQSTSTRLRWNQIGLWLNNQDNWALDNVMVSANTTSNYTYTWSPIAALDFTNGASVIASPSTNSTYYVTTTDPQNGCTYTDSILVLVDNPFTLTLASDTLICDPDGVSLSAWPAPAGNYSFLWTPELTLDDSHSNQPLATPSTNTTYTVLVSSPNGCQASGSITVDVPALLNLSLSSDLELICANDEAALMAILDNAPADVTMDWSPGLSLSDSTLATPVASPSETTTYTCTVNYLGICSVSQALTIEVAEPVGLEVTPWQVDSCIVMGTTLLAEANTTYPVVWQWAPADVLSQADIPNPWIIVDTSLTLTITATAANGCAETAEIPLNFEAETIDFPDSLHACEGQLVVLDTGHPESYSIEWSNGYTTPLITVAASEYIEVEAISPGGCLSSAAVQVQFYPLPPVPELRDSSFCEGTTLTLDAYVGPYSYHWSNGPMVAEIEVESTGIYTVEVSNEHCSVESSCEINIFAQPEPPFAQAEVEICLEHLASPLELNAENEGMNYLWNTGSETQVISIANAGTYSVTVTSSDGCSAVFAIDILNTCPGVLFVPNSFTPDQDGINDVWFVEGERIAQFEIYLYDRWGEVFFQSNDLHFKWLGQRRDGGFFAEPGVYPYMIKIHYLDANGLVGQEEIVRGFVTLIR